MKKIASILLMGATTSLVFAAAYKIPEQSVKSLALGAAYVAGADEADASYYNPANMSFMDDGQSFEFDLTTIYLPKIEFDGQVNSQNADAKSKAENFLVPHFHYVSQKINNFRFGLSLTTPGGLSKRWDSLIQKTSAEEFTLKVVEVNPSFSYLINEKLSFGGGIRFIYSEGIVKSDGYTRVNNILTHIARDMEGDTGIKFGYNLALSYKVHPTLTLAATYRSKINLKEEGNAKLYKNHTIKYDGGSSVTVPLPAATNIAIALDISETTKVELVYERTYWSSYKYLDFNYASPLTDQVLIGAFDKPKEKNWKDSNTFRFGITHKNSDKLTTMYGIAYDESPIPDRTLGFELPDNDAILLSLGAIYNVKENMKIGVAYLYDYKLERTIEASAGNINNIVGTFKKGGAHLLNLSFNYRF